MVFYHQGSGWVFWAKRGGGEDRKEAVRWTVVAAESSVADKINSTRR
mgnify:CR=1 FL=1